jgi:hypothetical protein
MAKRRSFAPEQIITKLREAEIHLGEFRVFFPLHFRMMIPIDNIPEWGAQKLTKLTTQAKPPVLAPHNVAPSVLRASLLAQGLPLDVRPSAPRVHPCSACRLCRYAAIVPASPTTHNDEISGPPFVSTIGETTWPKKSV